MKALAYAIFGSVSVWALTLGCAQKPEECKSWSSTSDGAGWSQCGDGKRREISCAPSTAADQPRSCTCNVGGVVGKSFSVTDTSGFVTLESATQIANQQCGWKITR
jgi:hypothetical protein